jgi:homoserine kinase
MAAAPRKNVMPGIEIVLPATSANLGPAFDSAAIAIRLYLKVRAFADREFRVAAHGRDAKICARPDNNLLIETYRDVMKQNGRELLPLRILMQNEVPVGKGLGSSAAARLAGVALAVHFGKLRWTDQQIVAEAARREHHADNAGACWLGGLVLVGSGDAGQGLTDRAPAYRIRVLGDWPLLFAIPRHPLSTEKARSVLPDSYSSSDAVANVQRAMLLAAAFLQGRSDLLRQALDDCIHQPYRSAFCPLLEPLRSLAGQHGIIGAVLSGAGPSVLLFLDPQESAARIRRRIGALLRQQRLDAELVLTKLETRGARERRRRITSSRSVRG